MASYQVYFVCPACKKKHRAPVHLELARGPKEEESVEEVFGQRARPPEVANLGNTRFLCPRENRYVQPSEEDLTIAREDVGVAATADRGATRKKKAPARKKKPARRPTR